MFKRFCLFSFRREPNGLFAALEASCGLKVHYFILNLTFTVLLQIESEDQCTSQLRTLIDQISLQQGQIVSLEEEKQRLEQECGQLKVLVQELERKGLGRLIDKEQVPVAAVVIMACNRADYLERTVKSVLKYQSSVASKFPLFVSQDGSHPAVKEKALSYDQLTYMQHLDYEPVHTERPGELIAYYKIAQVLYRSDFFPGLGWMLARSTWDELSPKWPKAYWDDWLRLKENHKDRQFIRPEVCRTYNFGEHGSSLGQFFKQYLEPIKLNDVLVDWKSMDLNYLMEDKYIKHFADIVKKAKPIRGTDLVLKARNIGGDVRVQYNDQPDFERIARQFGIFEEWKDGVPRTAYKGIVVFRYQITQRIFLVGPGSLVQLGVDDS
ncbi:alpha-1,3-mannosyl-glycoprotein 2-beta-N-acetylglucosaminyltransferase isoform X3 [Prunus dulcis]|uniref:alpha-1,3-mannosyl-glycoprotein 2-beta-N-acetylglucosaminyltransferase isoform X3 n=1 Tax=Prunus dulcis TaxID=3755 RepID=UPI0014820EAA|nr:alpha-1,3-mannosyl-glycoprotein 2-beta-N-acetylglucosaminyltransferase isoform X3 [Prunus dulcis]